MENLFNAEKAEMQESPAELLENQGTPEAPEAPGEEIVKTFSQDDVNRIVQERIARERERINAVINEEAQIRKELEAEKLKLKITKDLSNRGIPIEMAEFIDCSSQASYEESAEKIVKVYDIIYKYIMTAIFKQNGRIIEKGSSSDCKTNNLEEKLREAFTLK